MAKTTFENDKKLVMFPYQILYHLVTVFQRVGQMSKTIEHNGME